MPVLDIGGYAVYIPYHTTWAHEKTEHHIENERFLEVEKIDQVLPLLEV
jgi:putative hydrolase of the HAD superfamily